MLFLLTKSILVGLAIAAMVGPISIICIRIGLTKGMKAAFITGLGAAVADGIYGLIAAFGIVGLDVALKSSNSLNGSDGLAFWGPIIGALFMLYLAIKILRAPAILLDTKSSGKDNTKSFITIFFLTLSNPMTILSFIAIFAGLGITTGESVLEKQTVVIGVFLGSAIWWLILSIFTGWLRHKISSTFIAWINRTSALILAIMALIILIPLMIA